MQVINSVINYFKASYRELGKVSWPSRKETTRLTIFVIAVVIIAAVILAVIDFGLNELINYFLGINTQA